MKEKDSYKNLWQKWTNELKIKEHHREQIWKKLQRQKLSRTTIFLAFIIIFTTDNGWDYPTQKDYNNSDQSEYLGSPPKHGIF